MKETLAKIASYVWDIPIVKTTSPQNEYLEVVWSNGKKMLNTKDANFSFGNGYKVFEKAISHISSEVSQANSILILGFGCGSILHLLEKKYNFVNQIDGVEYDPKIVELFQTHFSSNYENKVDITICDAEEYLLSTTERYDIIFIDLFIELENSPLLFSKKFIDSLSFILAENGTLVFNTTDKSKMDKKKLNDLLIDLSMSFKNVSTHEFQSLNRIIIAK